MISPDERKKIDAGWLTVNIIWGALLVSIFMYVVVGLYMEDKISIPMDEDQLNTFRSILLLVAFATLIASHYIRKIVLSAKGAGVVADASQLPSRVAPHPALARYTSAMVISLALSESVGIYGLVLFLISKNHLDLFFLLFLSAAAMIYYRPRKEEVIKLAERGMERRQ